MQKGTKGLAANVDYWIRQLSRSDAQVCYAVIKQGRDEELELRFVAEWYQDRRYHAVRSQYTPLWLPSKRRLYGLLELALVNLHRERAEHMLGLTAEETLGEITGQDTPF